MSKEDNQWLNGKFPLNDPNHIGTRNETPEMNSLFYNFIPTNPAADKINFDNAVHAHLAAINAVKSDNWIISGTPMIFESRLTGGAYPVGSITFIVTFWMCKNEKLEKWHNESA